MSFSYWSQRNKVPVVEWTTNEKNYVGSRSWELTLANTQQEKWELQYYDCKELNSAQSHVILEEDPELKEHSLAKTLRLWAHLAMLCKDLRPTELGDNKFVVFWTIKFVTISENLLHKNTHAQMKYRNLSILILHIFTPESLIH